MRLYDYIFYKISLFLRNFIDSPGFGANMVMCWLLLFNGVTIVEFTVNLSELSDYINKLTMIGYAILILIFHFTIYTGNRQVLISEKFKDEGRISNGLGNLSVLAYTFLTVFVFFKYTVPRIEGVLK